MSTVSNHCPWRWQKTFQSKWNIPFSLFLYSSFFLVHLFIYLFIYCSFFLFFTTSPMYTNSGYDDTFFFTLIYINSCLYFQKHLLENLYPWSSALCRFLSEFHDTDSHQGDLDVVYASSPEARPYPSSAWHGRPGRCGERKEGGSILD